jgi:hypothetical protein
MQTRWLEGALFGCRACRLVGRLLIGSALGVDTPILCKNVFQDVEGVTAQRFDGSQQIEDAQELLEKMVDMAAT